MMPLRVFIGYDSREPVAYHVLAHSILSRASGLVSLTPLVRAQLQPIYQRERGPTESTEFSMTRFLVPFLSQYEGWSLFMDCDMLCRTDIAALWQEVERHHDKAVLVCPHDYTPATVGKFLGQAQTTYPRKNWSSFMLFNNARCRALSPAYVNSASGLVLHRFQWLVNEQEIGYLPLDWNWLVGEYAANYEARVWHYTLGGPWFREFECCDHAAEWFEERRAMLAPPSGWASESWRRLTRGEAGVR